MAVLDATDAKGHSLIAAIHLADGEVSHDERTGRIAGLQTTPRDWRVRALRLRAWAASSIWLCLAQTRTRHSDTLRNFASRPT